jgi:hypothetical protein
MKKAKTTAWSGLVREDVDAPRRMASNPLMDQTLMRFAESDLRRTQHTAKSKPTRRERAESALDNVRPYRPHERGFSDTMSDVTGTEIDQVTTGPDEPCERCQENQDMLSVRLRRVAETEAVLADVIRSGNNCEDRVSARRIHSKHKTVSTQRLETACGQWLVAELMRENYIDAKTGMRNRPKLEAELDLMIEARSDDDRTMSAISESLKRIKKLDASVDLDNPKTHWFGYPIPESFRNVAEVARKKEVGDAKAFQAQLKRTKLVSTNFKKKPPVPGEQLILDHDGTGRTLRVVTVTSMRSNGKGFVVDKGMKVSWSGKPKTEPGVFPESVRILRSTEELRKRVREASISLLENYDWSGMDVMSLGMAAQIVSASASMKKARELERRNAEKAGAVDSDKNPRKQGKYKSDADRAAKAEKTKNKSSKRRI